MNKQEFNRLCAEYMGYKFKEFTEPFVSVGVWNESKGNWFPSFDPYSDANDRNKVIEKMGISTIQTTKGWCVGYHEPYFNYKSITDKSMEAAQIKCIQAVLEQV